MFFCPVKFSYCSLFRINIVIGSGVIRICFYKGLTKNPEIGYTPASVFPDIWRLVQIMNTKFGAKVLNKMLVNAANYQGYRFYRLLLLRGNQQARRGGRQIIPSPRLGLIEFHLPVTDLEPLTSFNKFNNIL